MSGKRAAGLGGVIVVALVVLATTYLFHANAKTQMVPDNATPEQVVRAYLDALNTHDCETARELSTGINVQSSKWWCDDLESATGVIVRPHRSEDPTTTGHDASVEVVDVPVHFNLKWRPGTSDPTVEDITDVWEYLLMRNHPDEPWRIFDQGVG